MSMRTILSFSFKVFACVLLLAGSVVHADVGGTDTGKLWIPVPTAGVTNPSVRAIAEGNNRLYIGGEFDRVAPMTGNVAVLSDTEVSDTSFDGNEVNMDFPRLREGVDAIYAIESDQLGGWYIGGDFSVVFDGKTFTNAIHIDSSDAVDLDWQPNPDGPVRAIEYDSGNNIVYLGGEFTSFSNNVGAVPWFDADWHYRQAITIDSSKVEVNEANYPVLLTFSDPDLRDILNGGHVAQDDGGDIIFVKDDQSRAAHEIESYDETSGVLVVWVEMPVSTVIDRQVFMYYGNPAGGLMEEDAVGTWDTTTADYQAVYHMNDVAGTVAQSTGSGVGNGMVTGGPAQATFAGSAVDFDGVDDVVTIGPDPLISGQSPFTVSAWVRRDDIASAGAILAKHGDSGSNDVGWALKLEASGEITYTRYGLQASPPQTVGQIADMDAWHHIAVTVSDAGGGATATHTIYLDGVAVLSTVAEADNGTDDLDLLIGAENDQGGANPTFADLSIDEVRIASTALSAEWIATGYVNQVNPTLFFSVAAEEKSIERSYLGAVGSIYGDVLPFDPSPDDVVRAIFFDDGNNDTIFVGGLFADIAGQTTNGLAGLDSDGAHDIANVTTATLTLNAGAEVHALAGDGTYLFIGGSFTDVGADTIDNFAGYDIGGDSVENTWPDANGEVHALVKHPTDADLVVLGGEFTQIDVSSRTWLGMVDISGAGSVDAGTADASDATGTTGVQALAAVGTTIYAGGLFDTVDGASHLNFVALDATFNPIATDLDTYSTSYGTLGGVCAIAQDGTNVCAGGTFMTLGGVARDNLYAMDTTTGGGTYRDLDAAWVPNPTHTTPGAAEVNAILVDTANNKVYVGGRFDDIGGQGREGLAKLDEADGVAVGNADNDFPDLSASTQVSSEVNALSSDGTDLHVAGRFDMLDATAMIGVGAITLATEAVVAGFPTLGTSRDVQALHVDGTILYVGSLQSMDIGGETRIGAAAIDLGAVAVDAVWDASLDALLDTESASAFHTTATGIYIGGTFDDVNGGGIIRRNFGLFDLAGGGTGSVDTTFDTSEEGPTLSTYPAAPFGKVNSILQFGDSLIIGGNFDQYDGSVTLTSNARVDATTGVVDPDFDLNLQPGSQTGPIVNVMLKSGNAALVGGDFYSVGPNSGVAHILGEYLSSSLSVNDPVLGALANGATATDFGSVDAGKQSMPLEITLTNDADGSITLGTPTLGGTDPSEYSLDTTGMATSLSAGASTTFKIFFAPDGGGAKAATVTFTHTDDTETSPFVINLTGTGLTGTMAVYQDSLTGTQIPNGATFGDPEVPDFGTHNVAGGLSTAIDIVIENSGDGTLILGTPTLGGDDPTDFLIVPGTFSTEVPPGANTTFTLYFDPASNGNKIANVSFNTNDPAEAAALPFTFEITGFAATPLITVKENSASGTAIADGGSATPFTEVFVGEISVSSLTIVILNQGVVDLNLGIPTLSGTNSGDFSIDTTGYLTVVPQNIANTSFEIYFSPTGQGTRTATVTIPHDDPNDIDGEWEVNISGEGESLTSIEISTDTILPSAFVGQDYTQTLNASGGSTPFTWIMTGGVLPPGLSFNSVTSSGVVSGTIDSSASGQYVFSVKVTDNFGDFDTKPFAITILGIPPNVTGLAPSGGRCVVQANGSESLPSLFLWLLFWVGLFGSVRFAVKRRLPTRLE